MLKRFTSGTPHGNALKHLRNMFGYFAASALLVLFVGCGASVASASIVPGIFAALLTAGIGLVGGIFATMFMRNAFGLVQTGRLLQYAGFWFTTWLALHIAAAAFGGAISLTAPLVAAFCIFALAFTGATAFGEVPKRTWLPIKKKKR